MSRLMLDFLYLNSYGCDKDGDEGTKLIEEISDDNDSALIIIILGELCHSAGPKNQNFLKALGYYQKIPEGTQRRHSLRGIGLLYEHDYDVEQNYQEALAYYQKAADEQNKVAYYNIVLLYYHGVGVDKDYMISFRRFTKLIEQEVKYALEHICVLSENYSL